MMYAFAKPEAVRHFAGGKRDPTVPSVTGERPGRGVVFERPVNARRSGRMRMRPFKKRFPLKTRQRQGAALIDGNGGALRREVDPEEAREQIRRTPSRSEKLRGVSGRFTSRHSMQMRCSARASRGTRDYKSASVQRLHGVLERILAKDVNHPGACHCTVHATESTVVPEREHLRSVSRQVDSGRVNQPHPSHTWNEVGNGAIRCAPTSRRGIRISSRDRRRVCDLSVDNLHISSTRRR